MKRIRLTLGALTASPEEGGRFTFFLYKEDTDKCLPVTLEPQEMHAMLINMKDDREGEMSIHNVVTQMLLSYKIELLELEVLRDDESDIFVANILLFDGEREVNILSTLTDGIILSKKFGAPLFISPELMDKYGVGMDKFENLIADRKSELEELKEKLQNAIDTEDYERASLINMQIKKLNNKKP